MTHPLNAYDYLRYAVLIVDEEEATRKYFNRLFGQKFRVFEAATTSQALGLLRKQGGEVAVMVSRQSASNPTFLSKVTDDYPSVVSILTVTYEEVDTVIGIVNQGGIFRYVMSPWDIPQLEVILRRAIEFYTVKRERDELLMAKIQSAS
jgi:DNA-binding NtrC family response regulator